MATKESHQIAATWVFGSLTLVVLIYIFLFSPEELPTYKYYILGIFCAVTPSFFAFFFTGSANVSGRIPFLSNLFVRASGSILIFFLVLFWFSNYAPIASSKIVEKLAVLKKETSQDPRKELSNLGIPWSADKFLDFIKVGDLKVIKLFLDGGMHPHTESGPGTRPLPSMLAQNKTNPKQVLELLLKSGLDLNYKFPDLETAGHIVGGGGIFSPTILEGAIELKNIELMEALVENGVDLKNKIEVAKQSPVFENGIYLQEVTPLSHAREFAERDPSYEPIFRFIENKVAAVPQKQVEQSQILTHDTGYPPAFSAIEVAGVSLGMSPDQVKIALSKFDPKYRINYNYKTVNIVENTYSIQNEYPDAGRPIEEEYQSHSILFGITATKETDDEYEIVLVYFKPASEQSKDLERAATVVRWKTYHNGMPAVASLLQGMKEKVGELPSFVHGDTNIWQFDPATGKVVTKQSTVFNSAAAVYLPWVRSSPISSHQAMAQMEFMLRGGRGGAAQKPTSATSPEEIMPRSVSPTGPISLQITIGHNSDGPLLAKGFTVLLMDEKALFTAFADASNIAKNIYQKHKDEEVLRAQQRREKM